jgi:hypothetical protein
MWNALKAVVHSTFFYGFSQLKIQTKISKLTKING